MYSGGLRAAIWQATLDSVCITNGHDRWTLLGLTSEDTARFLYSIAWVESRGEWERRDLENIEGAAGEIGPFQIMYGAAIDGFMAYKDLHGLAIRRSENDRFDPGFSLRSEALFPDMTTIRGQACNRILYLWYYGYNDRPQPREMLRTPDAKVMMYLKELVALHHGGPDKESSRMVEYINDFLETFHDHSEEIFRGGV